MKKLLSVLSAVTLLMSCTSCSEKITDSSIPVHETVTIGQTIYQEQPINIAADIAYISQIFNVNEEYYVFYTDTQNTFKLTKLDSKFKVTDTIDIENIGAVCVHDDGSFAILSSSTDFAFEYDPDGHIINIDEYFNSARLDFKLTEYDVQGQMVSEINIPELSECYDKESSRLNELHLYENGYLLMFETGAAIISADGNITELQLFPEHFGIQTALDSENQLIAADTSGYQYINGNKFTIPPEFSNKTDTDIWCIATGYGDFKALLELSDGIYGLTESNELILIFDFDSSLVNKNEIDSFISCGDGEFLAFDDNQLKRYIRRPDDYTESRKRLDVWRIDEDGDIRTINEFNKISDKYFISCKEMADFTELKNAILTGDAPDLIFYDNMTYMERLNNLGALADMSELMDSGTGLGRDDIMPNVLEAVDRDGSIYVIPQNFMVSVCITDKSYIGEEYHDWTINEFIELCDSRPDGMYVSHDLSTYNPFLSLLIADYDVWIDPANADCNFDTPEFIELLNFFKNSKDIAPVFDLESDDSYGSLKERRSMMSCNGFCGIGLEHLLENIAIGGLGGLDDAALLNYPGRNGKGQIEPYNCWSVLESSNCKEGAWEFISYALSKNLINGMSMNSSYKKSFDECIESKIKPKEEQHIVNLDDNIRYTDDLTPEQAEKYCDFIENCNTLRYHDYQLSNILNDEYTSFINGGISAEECAKRIQNRVSIYLSEQS